MVDVVRFLSVVINTIIHDEHNRFCWSAMTVTNGAALWSSERRSNTTVLLRLMNRVDDTHVMRQTLRSVPLAENSLQ